ncbi:hypothetical protein FRC07_003571 [Ceratobasidium sp. 392]|nr:hypothetical protein FRC07_003571 [Ceratobasidium sp. 392]
MARPGLFKPVEIDDHGIKLEFADAGLGCNNPTARMLDEAKRIFPGRHAGCIISVGTGQAQTINISTSRRIGWSLSGDLNKVLQRVATDCEETAQQLQVRFCETPNVYFRFNTEQGLQDIGIAELERLPEVAAHARQDNQQVTVRSKLNDAAEAVVSGGVLVPTARLDGAIVQVMPKARIKTCPRPSPNFTGQNSVLAQLKSYFLDGSNLRHIFVLHGLGGSGKTQIALKFVDRHKDSFWDVFYVDASSAETISADFESIAIVKKAGDTVDDALAWLTNQDEEWLIVFNNADNTSLRLPQYFPTGAHGDILITTRNRDMINITSKNKSGITAECYISRMEPDDAKGLLLKASGIETGSTADKYSNLLVKEFEYLALAIIQAGAYIRVNDSCTLEGYLEMFRKNKLFLEESRNIILKSDDYSWTAYTTWRISYDQLRVQVFCIMKELLKMCFKALASASHYILRN